MVIVYKIESEHQIDENKVITGTELVHITINITIKCVHAYTIVPTY